MTNAFFSVFTLNDLEESTKTSKVVAFQLSISEVLLSIAARSRVMMESFLHQPTHAVNDVA